MKNGELLALGQMAIAKGVFDIRLRATWLKLIAVASFKDEKVKRNAEEAFCARVSYLLRTGVIEIDRKPKVRRRAA